MNEKGMIGHLILFLSLLVIVSVGVFYFSQNAKASSSSDNDRQLNSFFVTASTINWKTIKYQDIDIKYPSDWKAETFDLGTGERVAFTNLNTKTVLFFANMSSSHTTSCEEFLNSVLHPPGSDSGELKSPISTMKFKEINAQVSFGGASAMGYSAKEMRICFEKNDQKYAMTLQEQGSGKDFAGMKDMTLILNSLKFN